MTFTENNLEAQGKYADVSIPRAEIVDFEHSVESGVEGVGSEAGVSRDGNNMTFSGLADNSEISVFNMAGVRMSAVKASGGTR